MKKFLIGLLLALSSTFCLAAWPTKPITIIVPYPAGGCGDALGRIFQPDLESILGVPVVYKFMPGAANAVAINHVLSEENDDHTFISVGDDFVTAQYVVGTKLYEKFTPVTFWATYPALVYGNSTASLDKFKQQIKQGKTVNVGNMGVNGSYHLWTSGLKSNLTINAVPYKGSAPLLVDVLGGHVEYAVGGLMFAQQLVDDGKIKPIMVSTLNRHPLYKNVPTYRELGIKGEPFVGWQGFVARKDTSTEALEKMSLALRSVVRFNPKIQDQTKQGLILINLNIPESQKFMNDAVRKVEAITITK